MGTILAFMAIGTYAFAAWSLPLPMYALGLVALVMAAVAGAVP